MFFYGQAQGRVWVDGFSGVEGYLLGQGPGFGYGCCVCYVGGEYCGFLAFGYRVVEASEILDSCQADTWV